MSQPTERHVLRPEHFTLAPQLLGLPLASPGRRLAALLVDLLIVAVLARAGGSLLLGVAAAWAFLRFAGRSSALNAATGRRSGRKRTWLLRAAGAFILFLVAKDTWNKGQAVAAAMTGSASSTAARPATPALAGVGAAASMVALRRADDPGEARAAAAGAISSMRAAGASEDEIMEAVDEASDPLRRAWLLPVIDSLLAPPGGSTPAVAAAPAESLAVWHAAALTRHDTAAVDSLAPALASALARDSLDLLAGQVSDLQRDRDELRGRVNQAENSGILSWLLRTLDELGIGFGWTGLYFTVLTALWKGQTAGKRLMGVRVMRLNGEPMTLWMSFERFGGYAAGLVTGLLGFVQIFWDKNRQAIHDKITETVVVREQVAVLQPALAAEPGSQRPRYRAPV